MEQKSIYIIAGESSGDLIGSELLKSIKTQADLQIHGIGGEKMQAQGLQSLFPMQELSMMGFIEILPHIFKLKRRIKQTVADILDKQPDILITIDSPGFTFRVVKELRESGFSKQCIHYVAPTVWAYKPHRAAKTAKLFDKLLVLLPFEPPYFEAQNLQTHFVGHPIAWLHKNKGDGAKFRTQNNIANDATILGMMPGSRKGELKRHLPIFMQTAKMLKQQIPNLHIVIPTNENIAKEVTRQTANWPLPVTITTDKNNSFAACNLALAKSGTVALETAIAGIPTITCFKANPISVWLVRRMIQVEYINLINIMASFEGNPAPIDEFIQQDCTSEKLSTALLEMHNSPHKQSSQQNICARYCEKLGMEEAESPSNKAAEIILSSLRIE